MLQCHGDTPAPLVDGISVAWQLFGDGQLWLRYFVDVAEENLVASGPAEPLRTDGLWNSTCFELFVRRPETTAYIEYNFAPSGQWAAYQFADYRRDVQNLPSPDSPEIGLDLGETHFALEATVRLPAEYHGLQIDVSLTAVIELRDGSKSYWSLRHPPGQPDFHHPDCFALTLEAPEQS